MNKRTETIRRIVITGNKEERKKAYDYLDRNEYRIIYSNPKILKDHTLDISKFKMIGEKRVK